MRHLTEREIHAVSGGNVSDVVEIVSDIASGIIDGPVNTLLNIIPDTITLGVKLGAKALTLATQIFCDVVGFFAFW